MHAALSMHAASVCVRMPPGRGSDDIYGTIVRLGNELVQCALRLGLFRHVCKIASVVVGVIPGFLAWDALGNGGKEAAKVYLRAADCGPRLWTVEVLFDGQGRMYLDKGWEKFAIAHGVDFGFVHFKYEGDDVLTVKVFDGTMCRKYYYSDDEDTTMKATTT
ncbi:hypothetical protein QYE76_058147 [Lolium multiflorum]|uniref:TF-B3 domain-containing protein n=1 Tax=Lolium multiflorum TaxID=4521 RepID=A0AAD8T4X6_LOLMU|nr:hypothetical protein QYE76_058147 [Lolium multiflorum]